MLISTKVSGLHISCKQVLRGMCYIVRYGSFPFHSTLFVIVFFSLILVSFYFFKWLTTVNCMSSGRLRSTYLSNCDEVWSGYKL